MRDWTESEWNSDNFWKSAHKKSNGNIKGTILILHIVNKRTHKVSWISYLVITIAGSGKQDMAMNKRINKRL